MEILHKKTIGLNYAHEPSEFSIEVLSPSFHFVQGYDAPHPVSLDLLKYPTRPTHSWPTHGELLYFSAK